jgi:hypothetical protein
MSVTPSPIGGFAAQFFDNNGQPLSGGAIYTYAAGTTLPQATYTSALGIQPHSNPIVLDSAGRVPGGEIWLTDGLVYKFVIETSTGALIGTYDNITGVNSNFVNYTVQEEVQTATAGQTVFNLATINYTPATNSLSVYIDGVNQYVGDSYLETDSNTVTFTSGLHVGAEVKFTTAVQTTTGAVDASIVSYNPPFTGSVVTDVETKLAQYVSVKDFGAVGDGVADDTTEIQAALNSNAKFVILDEGTFLFSAITIPSGVILQGAGKGATTLSSTSSGSAITLQNITDAGLKDLRVAAPSASRAIHVISTSTFVMRPLLDNVFISAFSSSGIGIFFDVQGANPIYFPRMYNVDIDGGSAAPAVGTRIGIAYGGAGSTITVGPQIFGARITNTLQGITHSKVDTATGFGVQLDGQTDGSSAGLGLLFSSGGGGYNKYWGTRFEASAVDTFVSFNAGSADNYVEGSFGGAAPAKIIDAGVRNSWSGADGSGGLIDNAASAVNFASGVKIGGNETLQSYDQGTFTPTIFGGSTAGTATYAYQVGEYTRIGNRVYFSTAISYSGHTGTGSLNVGGLPIAARTRTNMVWSQTVNIQNIAFTGPVLIGTVSSAATSVQCSQIAATGTTTAIPIAASGFVSVTGSYEV